jgi:ribosome maturation factor RimP
VRDQVEKRIEDILAPAAAAMGLEILSISFKSNAPGRPLQIVIDRLEGKVSLGDCVAFSRQTSALLDEADPIDNRYRLEVSSPGVERPLRNRRDFERFKGEEVAVVFETEAGSRRVEGTLQGTDDECVEVLTKKTLERIPHAAVTRANLRFRFGERGQ